MTLDAVVGDIRLALSANAAVQDKYDAFTAMEETHAVQRIECAAAYRKANDEMKTAQNDYFDRKAEVSDAAVIATACNVRNAEDLSYLDAVRADHALVTHHAKLRDASIAVGRTTTAFADETFSVAWNSFLVMKAATKPFDHIEASMLMKELLQQTTNRI
jgi:hypothetical protein